MLKQVTKSIIVKGNVADIYDFWANFENFPTFMKHVKSVSRTDDQNYHWVMESPLIGIKLEWDTETTRQEKNRRIAWSSKDNDGDITTSGQVTFTALPHNQVEVTLTLQYVLSPSLIAGVAADLFGDFEGMVLDDLRSFKAHMEGMPQRAA